MKAKNYGVGFVVVALMLAMMSCGNKGAEEQRKLDSLFLGISLGMGKKTFFDHCWELNKQKMITHGPSNMNVEYHFKTEPLRDSVTMRFYPTFHNDKIDEMPVLYSYYGWAPWNKQYWSDTLLNEMLVVYKKIYGDDFKLLNHKTMGKVYYQMKGRRRINLFIRDEQFVEAVFTDMKVEKQKKEELKAEEQKDSE
jgi:hypothetical protein